jgi:dynein heavy chain, axonemal
VILPCAGGHLVRTVTAGSAAQAIDRADLATLPSKRIQNIMEYLTYEIYLYIQRGLFERHKLLFALMLANKVMLSAGSVRAADVDVFLKGGGALDIASVRKKPKDWIPDGVWLSVIALSQMDAFRDIPDSVFRNDGLWKQWCAAATTTIPVHHTLSGA